MAPFAATETRAPTAFERIEQAIDAHAVAVIARV
jgi:hypothetical protein